MPAEAMVTTLKSLKLHGMADAIGELAQQQEKWTPDLGHCLK